MLWETFLVIIGAAAIVWSFKPKMAFYPRAMGIGRRDRTVPRWFGRLWFIVIGLVLIASGLAQSGKLGNRVSAYLSFVIAGIFVFAAVPFRWSGDRHSNARNWLLMLIPLALAAAFFWAGLSQLQR